MRLVLVRVMGKVVTVKEEREMSRNPEKYRKKYNELWQRLLQKYYHIGLDPVNNQWSSGIDTRIVGISASKSPTDNTSNDSITILITNERSTRVTLASVFATFSRISSTNHRIGDASSISIVTLGIGNGRDLDVPQIGWKGSATRLESSPSTGVTLFFSGSYWKIVRRRQACWLDIIVQLQRRGKLEDDPIVVQSLAVVGILVVTDDLGNTSNLCIKKMKISWNHR